MAQNQRRSFLKKTVGVSLAVVATGGVASNLEVKQRGNGVLIGSSRKVEILYRRTPQWELYFRRSN